jgi:predicted ArsR family transcriptional regulator
MAKKARSQERADEVVAVSALGEPTRRALYDYVVGTGTWVSRDEAADAVSLERGTAAFHLDRLAGDGLLEVDFQRRSGRQGPGAGRPAKLYRRARRELEVNLPPRDYRLAGRLLADAAARSATDGTDITTALAEASKEEGRRLAEELGTQLRGASGQRASRRKQVILDALEERGFEPRPASDGTIVLGNCPFHQLAQEHTDLICGMNLCLIDAAVHELGETGFEAHLEPEEGRCCVKLRSKA